MAYFRVVVEKIDATRWRLARDLTFRSAWREPVTVPRGFVTDFASVPRMPLLFALFGDRGHAAAVVHDWLYQTHPEGWDKWHADLVFLEALKEEGVKPWRARAMYLAVKLFGRAHWESGPNRRKQNGNVVE